MKETRGAGLARWRAEQVALHAAPVLDCLRDVAAHVPGDGVEPYLYPLGAIAELAGVRPNVVGYVLIAKADELREIFAPIGAVDVWQPSAGKPRVLRVLRVIRDSRVDVKPASENARRGEEDLDPDDPGFDDDASWIPSLL